MPVSCRLPVEFRFDGNEVFVRRDDKTGDVILSAKPQVTWDEFFKYRDAPKDQIPADFMSERPLNTPLPPFGANRRANNPKLSADVDYFLTANSNYFMGRCCSRSIRPSAIRAGTTRNSYR